MPQVAERRNTYGPKSGSPKNGPPRQFHRKLERNTPPLKPAIGSVPASAAAAATRADKPEPEILFQKYFKSVGPRTYAAQLKRAANGNHFLVLTEGKRDDKTSDVRKTKLFVWSEDFVDFFKMLHETAKYIRENPLPEEIRQKREKYWARRATQKPADPVPPARAAQAAQKPKFGRR